MDQRNILDHQFVVAAYTVTWVIQLGYLAFLGLKWRRGKRHCRAQCRAQVAAHAKNLARLRMQPSAAKPDGITEFRRLP